MTHHNETEAMDTPSPGENTGAQDAANPPAKGRKVKLVAAGVVAVLAVAGLVGWRVLDARSMDAARQDYTTALTEQKTAHDALNALVNQGEEVSHDCASQVADEAVCEELTRVLDEVKELAPLEKVDVDGASKGELQGSMEKIKARTQALKDAQTKLNSAVDNVKKSVEAKALLEAKTAYNQALAAAETQASALQELIASTEGKVADEATRQNAQTILNELTTLITEAKTVGGDDVSKLADYTSKLSEKTTTAHQAHATVTDSHNAWTAAQNAAAARQSSTNSQAANTSRSNAGKSNSGTTTRRTTSGSTGSGTGSSTTTKTGGSSSGGWVESDEIVRGANESICMDTKGNSWACKGN